ncbi:MAG: 1,4-alpha-glucan branching protein GlgB [Deltaproteobacteria bacterium]|nr:MAG: 1,4-alpha-glucan branching protein GlgB [Deltaproteobacteria bacterium]
MARRTPQPLNRLERHLFHEGTWRQAWRKLGAHPGRHRGQRGFWFATWAPRADRVEVIGDMNGWDGCHHPLERISEEGLFQGFVAGARAGQRYKFRIHRPGLTLDKADPYAFATEPPPATASVLTRSTYAWGDQAWMADRHARNSRRSPISIYEVHAGSFLRPDGRVPTWGELRDPLIAHVRELGFTHVELLPVMEHPFYGSWGYQVTGYFAPSARHGAPDGLKALIDGLHQAGIGVILDFVPAHFPSDDWALARFDGEPLYEHADPRRGLHPDWKTCIFDYGRPEVRTFLTAAALYWLSEYHADGLRFDAVASMLYLDYSRAEGEWLPNAHGGREDLDAVALLQQINAAVYAEFPDIQTWAEESTAWPKVSRPTWEGGLGFGFKWDMGWMHDTLAYLSEDPIHRRHHHDRLTFRSVYAFSENFALPLSHDEVVHGKGSLFGKMPGDPWQKLANLRLLFAAQWSTPGKKLLFMGGEIGQEREWAHEAEVDWCLLDRPEHRGLVALIATLNAHYVAEPALHRGDCEPEGFAWIAGDDTASSVLIWRRRDPLGEGAEIVCVLHFTPVPRPSYRIGVPHPGAWELLLDTDQGRFGGSDLRPPKPVSTEPVPSHGHAQSLDLTLPPLGALWLRAPNASPEP